MSRNYPTLWRDRTAVVPQRSWIEEESQMTCRDLMTSNPAFCTPNDIVSRAAQIMRGEDVGAVPVVSDHMDRRLIGIITDRDIAIKAVADGRDPNTRVESI